MYKSLALNVNKSALNWTQVCQLHCVTQLHETAAVVVAASAVVDIVPNVVAAIVVSFNSCC